MNKIIFFPVHSKTWKLDNAHQNYCAYESLHFFPCNWVQCLFMFVWVSSYHKIIITVGFPDNHLPDVISEKKIKIKLSWIVLWIHKSSRRTMCLLSEWLGCCVNSCISRPLQFWISIAWLSSVLATTARSTRNPPEAQSLPSSYTRTFSSTTSTCRTLRSGPPLSLTSSLLTSACL